MNSLTNEDNCMSLLIGLDEIIKKKVKIADAMLSSGAIQGLVLIVATGQEIREYVKLPPSELALAIGECCSRNLVMQVWDGVQAYLTLNTTGQELVDKRKFEPRTNPLPVLVSTSIH